MGMTKKRIIKRKKIIISINNYLYLLLKNRNAIKKRI